MHKKKLIAIFLTLAMLFNIACPAAFAVEIDSEAVWVDDTLYLNNATINETVTTDSGIGFNIVVSGDCIINAGAANGIESEGAVNIEGNGSLTITGANGIMASSVTINEIDADFTGTSCGIQVYNENSDATVTLTNVNGSITGGYAGIYVNGECANSEASVTMAGCDLDVVSTATSYNSRARKAGVSVYVNKAEKVESSINILDSKVDATGADAGLSINNYLGDADATNSASSRINITNSTVTANGTNGTWAGIFASVLGQHADADSIITIKDSSVYAVSPNTGILTSSQQGESKIILDNSVLGASGKTALSMIESTSQAQATELKNGSTYIQMTPDAVMKGEIVNFEGKTIIATAGDGITYDVENHYYVIPQGSEVSETYTDGTENVYTFKKQAGGVGGFSYAKEEVWGYDVPDTEYVCKIVETGMKYESLTEAVAEANNLEGANTIEMLASIDFDSDKALSVNGDLTIIGKYTVSRGDYTGTLFTVPKGSSLTLDGGIVFDGSNNWIFNKELYENDLYNRVDNPISAYAYSAEGGTCGTAAVFVVDGSMTAKDATIQNFFNTKDSNAGDGAIFKVNANATLDTNGALINHVATYGANAVAHLASNAKWYIEDGTMISNNFGGRNGGICRNDSGQIYMSGGTIKDTAGKNVNGTVFMMYGTGSQFIMTDGVICGNSSTFGANNGRCAAVYLHANSYMQMTGGTICHNVGGTRGGIDSYKSSSVLDINRVDQDFDNADWKENGAAAYTATNHPLVVDNVSLIDATSHDVGHSFNFDTWWVTGGIYTQDVDEFCAEGYVCIPYEDTERTDDYIVVPGYRVKYYSVDKIEENGTIEYKTTLEEKYFHLLPRDKFWYEMDERADYYKLTNDEGGTISTWYQEKEMTNIYDFANTKLESDLDVYGEWKYTDEAAVVLTIDMSGTMYRYKMGGTRYVNVAKEKALDFVNQYAAKVNNVGDKRLLAIASFDTDAKVVLNWVDVNSAEGLAAAQKAINGMKVADNGRASSNQVCTNFDGGIILTRNLLKQSAVSDIDNKFAIVLSDGAPTVTVNNDSDTVGTIKSSFWGKQLDASGKKYQNARAGGGWTHPGEVDRTLKYLVTGNNTLADLTTSYGENKEGIFFIGVGGDMGVKLFNDAVYGTSNGTRTSDVKRKPAAFNNIEALEGYTQAQILKMTTGDWLNNLASRTGGTYVSATNAAILQKEFNEILNYIVNS